MRVATVDAPLERSANQTRKRWMISRKQFWSELVATRVYDTDLFSKLRHAGLGLLNALWDVDGVDEVVVETVRCNLVVG
jgi:hypothetical protein